MKKYIVFCAIVCFLYINCKKNNNSVSVDNGGIGIKGFVYSQKDNKPLDSVRIILTGFEGIGLKTISPSDSVITLSDTSGRFINIAAMGYTIDGNGNEIDHVQKCKVIFSKVGFADTSFQLPVPTSAQTNDGNINIYLHTPMAN